MPRYSDILWVEMSPNSSVHGYSGEFYAIDKHPSLDGYINWALVAPQLHPFSGSLIHFIKESQHAPYQTPLGYIAAHMAIGSNQSPTASYNRVSDDDTFFVFWKFVITDQGRFFALYCENLQVPVLDMKYIDRHDTTYNLQDQHDHDCWKLRTSLTRIVNSIPASQMREYIQQYTGICDKRENTHTFNVWLSEHTPTVAFSLAGEFLEYYGNKNTETIALYNFNIRIEKLYCCGDRYHLYTLNPRDESQLGFEDPDTLILSALRRTRDEDMSEYNSAERTLYFIATRTVLDNLKNNIPQNYETVFPSLDLEPTTTRYLSDVIYQLWR